MGCKRQQRRAELCYTFDRLMKQKMEQVYEILLSKVMPDFRGNQELLVGQREKR